MSDKKHWNPRFFRPWIAIPVAAVIGGLVGYSQILCLTGYCPITGSWYGGALVGSLITFAVFSNDIFTPMKIKANVETQTADNQAQTQPTNEIPGKES